MGSDENLPQGDLQEAEGPLLGLATGAGHGHVWLDPQNIQDKRAAQHTNL